MQIALPKPIQLMRDNGALFVLNHSGGKDSQAMTILVRQAVPDAQIVVMHADLPEVDWEGCLEHIEATTAGLDLVVTRASKTFFDMVEHRQMFPSPKYRQCTSDLKRGPIDREIRRLAKARGCRLIVNCMGIRADESTARAKQPALKLNKRMSKAGRYMLDWLPIHELDTADVFATIANAGQVPHWAYEAGMSRLSCVFCIMACKSDLTTAAQLRPDLYRRYVETEKRLGFTLSPSLKGLEAITGIKA